MTLRTRLIVLGGVATLALAVLGAVTLTLMSGISNSAGTASSAQHEQALLDRAYESWTLNDDQNNMYAALIALHSAAQTALANTTWGQAVAGYRDAAADLAQLRTALAGQPARLAEVAGIVASLNDYNHFSQELRRAGLAGNTKRAVYIQTVANLVPSNALPTEFSRLQLQLQATGSSSTRAVRDQASSAILETLIVLALSIPLLVLVIVTTIRSITSGVRRITRRVELLRSELGERLGPAVGALASGDLTVELASAWQPDTVDRADELGEIMRALEDAGESVNACCDSYNQSAGQLRDLIGRVTNTAGVISDSSHLVATSSGESGSAAAEIADTIGTIAGGAERQVSMIDEMLRAAEQVAAGVAESAERAEETASMAAQARDNAHDGLLAAEQADVAMRAVQDSSESVTEAISELATMSEQIGSIVGTITSIAEQTNLLALNAAIEAARAGEHGRGFAVVAEQVRKLAEESSAATSQISGLVVTIQDRTASAVRIVHDGATQTEEGGTVVKRAAASFAAINAAIDEISARVADIAAASQEMTASAEALQQGMAAAVSVAQESVASTEQVAASTQQSSAATEQIAATAQSLAENARLLDELVGSFTV
jgi:methyl-accepting chemotaxis protein